MFSVALLIVAKTWKQLKCLSMGDWMKKMWNIYTMEDYSAIKKGEKLPFVTTWMDLESITLCEINQLKKDKNHMIMCGI